MIYAIISDIHGNYPALEAALADAGAHGADHYLFLGDYYRNFPWGDKVADTLRALSANRPATIIRGNNEGYLVGLKNQDRSQWIYEQFMLVYYNYRAFSPENIDYLISLPETAEIRSGGGNGGSVGGGGGRAGDGDGDGGGNGNGSSSNGSGNSNAIYLSHDSKLFIRTPKIAYFSSLGFRRMARAAPFTHGEYLARAREALLSCPEAMREIGAMPDGIYLHGHNHLQYHFKFDGKLFINPGSCGDPCDGSPAASYTLLECGGRGSRSVAERKVEYDLAATAAGLRGSALAAEAPFWAGVIERQLLTGYDYFGPFVQHIGRVGREHGQERMPVSNEAWKAAIATWDPEYI